MPWGALSRVTEMLLAAAIAIIFLAAIVRGYSGFGFSLLAITALEVSTYFWDEWLGEGSRTVGVVVLLILMTIKFLTVVSYFMHLKFDNKIFSWMFYSGLLLAIVVYVGALSTFKFFLAE